MTLAALLVVGALGSAGSAVALGRGGSVGRIGAIGGVLALVLIALLAASSPTPASLTPDASGAVDGTLWNGALVPGSYLRLVVVLWAGSSVVVVGVSWLLRGTAGLRGLLPGTLAALVGGTVALAASTPALAFVAAGAMGLASVPVVLASPRAAAAAIAAREVRIAVATALVVLAVACIAPVVARLVLANPDGPASGPGSGTAAAIAFGMLAIALAVAGRVGAIPYHVRVSALSDIVPAGAFPLVAAWLPLPLAATAVGFVVAVLVPLSPQVGSAQALIVAAVLLTTLAAALVGFIQDDLRHAVGYLTIADLGIAILALGALDPALWGPARSWLLSVAVTKTALAIWAAVVEDRFETRSVPELRGWLRPSPVLGIALALIVIATYGLPGWAVLSARFTLAGHGAGGPWDAALLVASVLTLPAYVRWLWLGRGAPTSHVDRAVPELSGLGRLPARRLGLTPPKRGRDAGLPVEQEHTEEPAAPAPAWVAKTAADDAAPSVEAVATTPRRRTRDAAGSATATQVAETVKRHRTGLLSGAVLALALLASLVAFGAFGVTAAACEAVPAVPVVSPCS